MITPPPNIGSWIKIELKAKDTKGNYIIWMGLVENVSDIGITINDGTGAAGGCLSVTPFWKDINGYKYFDKNEPGDFYIGY